jgi:tRNA(His) guanylyltransferase
MKDDLGKRMKGNFEQRTRQYLPRRTYTIIRLDGKSFHTFTKGMKRPYDETFMHIMDVTTKFLCSEIQGCKFAYTQSDEISLLLTDFDTITTDAWFDGQVQKMVSVAASIATAKFNQLFMTIKFEQKVENQKLAFFDARVFTIPDPIEVENYFIWRQKDAVRNSLSMHAQSLYSHKELHGKSQADMHDMIHAKGENWDNLPYGFKRGRSFLKREGRWALECPDFLKDRDVFRTWIPKITYE